MSAPEFRHNSDNTVDEIVTEAKLVHIEQMSDNCYWMGIDLPSGEMIHVNFWTPRARIRLNYNMDGQGPEGGEFNTGAVTPEHSLVTREATTPEER